MLLVISAGLMFLAFVAAGLGAFFWVSGLLGGLRAPATIGLGCVALLMVGLGGWLGDLAVKKKAREVRAGWNMLPVVAVTRDLPAGAPLTAEALQERRIPEQFLTASVVRPAERAEVIGRALAGPVKAGEPLTWLLLGKGLSPHACEPEGAGPTASAPGGPALRKRQ